MRGVSATTTELMAYARRLLEQHNPMTLRQLHYAIFSREEIPYANTKADYRRLSRVTTIARRAHRNWQLAGADSASEPAEGIPHGWIVDETRQASVYASWRDMSDFLDSVKTQYRRDAWQGQPNYCEIWCEKATILGSIRPITKEWGVGFRVTHGFTSTGMEGATGRLFENTSRPITVLYLGDHDPSGRSIEQDLHSRIQASSGKPFRMVRVAIHEQDIAAFSLPPKRIKDTDSRAKHFRAAFGQDAPTVELDALPVEEMRHRLTEAIHGLIDHDAWERQTSTEWLEFQSIQEIFGRVKSAMPTGESHA
jgi:hypothetical protein